MLEARLRRLERDLDELRRASPGPQPQAESASMARRHRPDA
jgi:hypothetical protein